MDRRLRLPFDLLIVLATAATTPALVVACAAEKGGQKPSESPRTPSAAHDSTSTSSADASPSPLPPKMLSVTECHVLWSNAASALREVETKNASCGIDGDCAIVKGGVCLAGWCDIAIAKTGASAYQATRERVAAGECASWTGGACQTTTPMVPASSLPMPSCPYVVPKCIGNKCAAAKH